MSQYNFEGAIDGISEPQLQFINKIIVDNGFENSKITFEHVGKAGNNCIANIKRIVIEGKNGNLRLIAKIASKSCLEKMMTTSVLFRNEHIMYKEVLPTFDQLQRDAGIPESEHLRYAKWYGSQTEEPHQVILLEDLQQSQFVMLDRFKPLSDECVRSMLKNFAILHSLSFVLRHKHPEKFENFKANLINNFPNIAENDTMKMYLQAIEVDTLSILEDPEHIKCLKNKVIEIGDQAANLSKADSGSKYTVIQQGDAWTNNIMFRFEDDNLTGSILINYQLSKNNSPVSDLMYMIFICTDYESRKQHFYDWIDYYHSELEKSLDIFDLKVNLVYPRDKLDADFKRYGKLNFGLNVLTSSLMSRRSEDILLMIDNILCEKLKLEQISIKVTDDELKTNYKNRIIGLINSYTEFGLL